MNLFETATRKAYRFPSSKGLLTVEDLWNLPLQSRSGFDLDNVAKTINAELRAQKEESFVDEASSPVKAELELKLEIVKHIIATFKAENAASRTAAERREQREQLMKILESKKVEGLQSLSIEELQSKIAELS